MLDKCSLFILQKVSIWECFPSTMNEVPATSHSSKSEKLLVSHMPIG